MKPIYLDYNATTPVAPEVATAMQPYLAEFFGNPSSTHWYGKQTRKAVEDAREQVAGLLGCTPGEIVFTSGGTEGNNQAIKGVVLANRERGKHLITSAIEHPAVLKVCDHLVELGFTVTRLPVDQYGLINLDDLRRAITPQTTLITIMHVNNEVGTIQPIAEISALARERGIIMHTDAAQSVSKIPTKVDQLGVDLLSVAGHKVYAPKGIGALYIREGIKLDKLMHGAGHENGRRAGTENVLEIVGLGQACAAAGAGLAEHATHMQSMRDRLHEGLKTKIENIRLNGHPEKRLPNTLSLSFLNLAANDFLANTPEIAASPGAACHADAVNISPVLEAMNVPREYAMGTVRFSVGRMTTADEIDRAVEIISDSVKRMRAK